VDSNTYRSLLNGLSLTPITFYNKRAGQYFTELLFYKGLLNKSKAVIIRQNISSTPATSSQQQARSRYFYDFLLDTAMSSETLPEGFVFEPLKVNKLSLLLQYPTNLYADKVPKIIEYLDGTVISGRDWYTLTMTLKRPTTESPEFNNIVQAILKQFENHVRTMRASELVRLSKKVEMIGVRLKRFWMKLYEEIVNSWEELSPS
jgi:hypothetical protein